MKKSSIERIKKEFNKKFLGFTIPDTKEGRFTAGLYWSFITHTLESERKHAYQKGYTKGRVETAKAMMALNELEKKVKQL